MVYDTQRPRQNAPAKTDNIPLFSPIAKVDEECGREWGAGDNAFAQVASPPTASSWTPWQEYRLVIRPLMGRGSGDGAIFDALMKNIKMSINRWPSSISQLADNRAIECWDCCRPFSPCSCISMSRYWTSDANALYDSDRQ
jgi:hypothetical protein